MLTFITAAFQVIIGYPVPIWGWLLVGFIDGLIWFPIMNFAFFPFMGKTIRTMIGRLHYLQLANVAGAVAYIFGRDGYEFAPVVDEGGSKFAIMKDGRRVEIDTEDAKVYQMARKPLYITFEPDEDVVGPYLDSDPEILDWIGVGNVPRYGILNRTRNGVTMFTKFVTPKGELVDGFLVSLSRVISDFRGGGGTEVVHDTQAEILKEKGGSNDFSGATMIWASVGVMVFMSIMSVLVFGGFI